MFSQKLTWLFFKFWFSEAAVRFALFEYSFFLISCSEKIPYYCRFLELRMELLRYFDPKINSKFNFLHFETTTMAFEAYIPLKLKYYGHVWWVWKGVRQNRKFCKIKSNMGHIIWFVRKFKTKILSKLIWKIKQNFAKTYCYVILCKNYTMCHCKQSAYS